MLRSQRIVEQKTQDLDEYFFFGVLNKAAPIFYFSHTYLYVKNVLHPADIQTTKAVFIIKRIKFIYKFAVVS